MPRGKKISEDLAWTVVRMRSDLDEQTISQYAGISIRSIRTIISRWRKTGKVVTEIHFETRGRHRQLTAEEVSFIHGKVLRGEENSYLDELKDEMEAICGWEISMATVWRTLQRGGFTLKKVQILLN
ncbi:hypothetical protein BDZ89DRAFT_1048643 [Hymenopellis radicata]|nr:hypothetical protein BDZ89DRAFT_1048643 [Hymenopellis radicata]